MEPLLQLRGFGVAFGPRVILSRVDLEIGDRELMVLLGPAGTGKSTLLRTLAGFNNSNPSLRTWGEARYAGADLSVGEGPALVSQSARLMLASVFENVVHALPERHSLTRGQQRELVARLLEEAGLQSLIERLDAPAVQLPVAQQRHLAIMRSVVGGPRLLCIDEPTSGLSDEQAGPLLAYIARQRERRAVLVVLHHLGQARRIAERVGLLAGGIVQESAPAEAFFATPRSAAAKDFIRTGSCAVPSPGADPQDLAADAGLPAPLPLPANCVSDSFGPRGFLWLKKGRLAGTPRPGIFLDLDYDLRALKRVGVTSLITLTEAPPDTDALANHGLESLWFPIRDMGAPGIAQASALCALMASRLAKDAVIAVHCHAGLGRTGTVLAAYLIWEGEGAVGALESVRRVEPRWVQSQEQVAFLEEFARHLDACRHSLMSRSALAG